MTGLSCRSVVCYSRFAQYVSLLFQFSFWYPAPPSPPPPKKPRVRNELSDIPDRLGVILHFERKYGNTQVVGGVVVIFFFKYMYCEFRSTRQAHQGAIMYALDQAVEAERGRSYHHVCYHCDILVILPAAHVGRDAKHLGK